MGAIESSKARLALVATAVLLALGAVGCGNDCETLLNESVACACEGAQCSGDPDAIAECQIAQSLLPAGIAECDAATDQEVELIRAARDLACVARDLACAGL